MALMVYVPANSYPENYGIFFIFFSDQTNITWSLFAINITSGLLEEHLIYPWNLFSA